MVRLGGWGGLAAVWWFGWVAEDAGWRKGRGERVGSETGRGVKPWKGDGARGEGGGVRLEGGGQRRGAAVRAWGGLAVEIGQGGGRGWPGGLRGSPGGGRRRTGAAGRGRGAWGWGGMSYSSRVQHGRVGVNSRKGRGERGEHLCWGSRVRPWWDPTWCGRGRGRCRAPAACACRRRGPPWPACRR